MKKNLKFFQLMARLDEAEVAGFGKYLQHEYPNEGNALSVYHYYKRFFPKKAHPEKMAIPYAYRKIYGVEMREGLRDPKKLWNAFSRLFLWLKNFLVLEKLRKDKFRSDVLWLEVLAEKGMSSEYSKETVQSFETNYLDVFSVESCQQQIELGFHFKEQLVQDRPRVDVKALEMCILHIKERADFISLKMNCEWLNNKKARPSKAETAPDKPIKAPLFLIYSQIYLMLTTEAVEHFMEIERMLQVHIAEIPPDETNTILRYLQNFAARRIQVEGARDWGKRFHELNKALLERDIHAARNIMSPMNFQNIITVACSEADLDWASEFITRFFPYLPQKVRLENIVIAQATIAFERKDFKKVIELTEKPQFKDEGHRIRSKSLELRSLYELGMDPGKEVEAFKTYLQRHRYPETRFKEGAIAFMTIFEMLLDLKASREELHAALDSNQVVLVRDWLKAKIDIYKSPMYRRNK